jgi:hypothetical protein
MNSQYKIVVLTMLIALCIKKTSISNDLNKLFFVIKF